MARVVGIGGVFVKSADPERLRAWYRDALGVDINKWGGAKLDNDQGTYGVWSSFAGDTKYFEPSTREFMLNLRVDDLPELLRALRERGERVLDRGEDTPYGKFGYVVDPDGTLVELFQPV
jgi:catechol 2,3-dioxygenase-like lactoylglutathione lyase family enzyme